MHVIPEQLNVAPTCCATDHRTDSDQQDVEQFVPIRVPDPRVADFAKVLLDIYGLLFVQRSSHILSNAIALGYG